jgi:hypothetical protein
MKIIPYIEINGCRTLTDEQMLDIWGQIVKDGNLNKVFYGVPQAFDKWGFLAFMKNPGNLVFTGFTNEDKPLGLCWINEIVGKRGTIHFCSIGQEYMREKIRAGKKIIDMVSGTLKVLVALIPEPYDSVRKYAAVLGFKELGLIPYFTYKDDEQIGTWIQYFTKEA